MNDTGISFTLNMSKGSKLSIQGLPVLPVVILQSSKANVCSVSLVNGVFALQALAAGEAVLTASILGITIPGNITVKVW